MTSPARAYSRIRRQFDEFDSLVPLHEQSVERVSGWSVGQHLDHLIQADSSLLRAIESEPDETLPPMKLWARPFVWARWLPRGAGKAPRATRPVELSPDDLVRGLEQTRGQASQAWSASEKRLGSPARVARHPYFGGLTVDDCWRFLDLHHHHHLKIVRDILRAD